MSELQQDIRIEGTKISGTLLHKSEFIAFSNDPTEQEGHYLVLKVEYGEDETAKFSVIGGKTQNKPFPPGDHQLVVLVSDAQKQKIRLDITRGDYTGTVIYDLSGLTLSPAA